MAKRRNATVSENEILRREMQEEGPARLAGKANYRNIELYINVERSICAGDTMAKKVM